MTERQGQLWKRRGLSSPASGSEPPVARGVHAETKPGVLRKEYSFP